MKLYHCHDQHRPEVLPVSEIVDENWFLGEVHNDPDSPVDTEIWLGLFCKCCMYDVMVDYWDEEQYDHANACDYKHTNVPQELLLKWKFLVENSGYGHH